jgi:hypothetical protein
MAYTAVIGVQDSLEASHHTDFFLEDKGWVRNTLADTAGYVTCAMWSLTWNLFAKLATQDTSVSMEAFDRGARWARMPTRNIQNNGNV